MPEYPWFKLVESVDLEQGDILEGFPLYLPREDDPASVEEELADLILMTQTCDIINDKVSHLLFCPLYSLEEYSEKFPEMRSKRKRNEIRAGRVIHMHMLNRCELEGFRRDFRLVNFTRVFQASKERTREFTRRCGKRIRLLPPYREHLAQAFARFFMRVGLPQDIPRFE